MSQVQSPPEATDGGLVSLESRLRCGHFADGSEAWRFQVHNMNSTAMKLTMLNLEVFRFAFQVESGKEGLGEERIL